MKFKFIIICLAYIGVVNSQYYTVPASSYPPYYNYYLSSARPYPPAIPNPQPRSLTPPPKLPKRNVASNLKPVEKSEVKCFPETASAYFMTTPSENVKSNLLSKGKIKETKSPTPTYACPLCNNFADVPSSSKIPPPPPVGSPVLPGIIENVPTICLPKNFTIKDSSSILSTKTPFSDMYEKNKVPKNLSFDQELLEGFLTGLGIAL